MKYIAFILWLILGFFYYALWNARVPACCEGVVVEPIHPTGIIDSARTEVQSDIGYNTELNNEKTVVAAHSLPGNKTIYFGYNTITVKLTPDIQIYFDSLVHQAQAEPSTFRVRLTGHTDDIGSLEVNEEVGRIRAKSIEKQLIGLGFPPNSLIVESRGETEPISFELTPAGRSMNRRVEIIIE